MPVTFRRLMLLDLINPRGAQTVYLYTSVEIDVEGDAPQMRRIKVRQQTNLIMLFSDIHKVLPSSTNRSDSKDDQIRYELISPFLLDLWEGKLIYHERVTMLVHVTELSVTPELLSGRATCLAFLIKNQFQIYPRAKERFTSWKFGAVWKALSIDQNSLYAYSGWTIWPDPELVKEVEKLNREGKDEEVQKLLWLEE